MDYQQSGVDIEVGNSLIEWLKREGATKKVPTKNVKFQP